MSLLLNNIAEFVAQNTDLVVADDGTGTLYLEKLPSAPDNAIMLATGVSEAPDTYLDTLYLDFDVWGRNQSTKTGSDVMDSIFLLLQRYHHLTLGDYYIYFINANGGIETLDQDSQERKLFKQSYRVIYRDTRTVS